MIHETAPVGTVVRLKINCLGNLRGALGICYESYERGSSFIFENGNYDGFSLEDQPKMLELIGLDAPNASYVFKNVIKVGEDFRKGHWDFWRIREDGISKEYKKENDLRP